MPQRNASRTRCHAAGDRGFTVLEVSVAISLIVIVMTGLAAFFVNSSNATDYQSQRQTASQLAENGLDKARALSINGAVQGRDSASTHTYWLLGQSTAATTKYPDVAPYLDDSKVGEAYDSTAAANTGSGAPLPTQGKSVSLGSLDYTQTWFLGYCNRQADGSCVKPTGAAVNNPNAAGNTLQVVVVVTWANKSCANKLCSYITAGSMSQASDPVYDPAQTASRPRVANPGQQLSYVGTAVSLTLSVNGGTDPMTWSATNLPAGLNVNTASGTPKITGTPTAATNGVTYVTLKVVDAYNNVSTTIFAWYVVPALKITAPTATVRSDAVNSTPSIQAAATGGCTTATNCPTSGGYTWSAAALPIGMSMNASTGKITGTMSAGYRYTAVIGVTDANNVSAYFSFTWYATGYITITTSGVTNPNEDRTLTRGTAVTITPTATGGLTANNSYTHKWTASNLPPGMSINGTTGVVSGTPTTAGVYNAVLLIADYQGSTLKDYAYYVANWTVS